LTAEPIRVNSDLLKLLKKATQQCVDNLSPSDASTDIDIDQAALVAILVLLRYHPQKEVGQFYIDKVNRIMRWKEEDAFGYRLKRKRKVGLIRSEIVFEGDPDPSRDRLDEVLDVILEYGKFYMEWKQKHKEPSA
jgi:hypothetical protein